MDSVYTSTIKAVNTFLWVVSKFVGNITEDISFSVNFIPENDNSIETLCIEAFSAFVGHDILPFA